MQRILILGAGGHGQVVADILREMARAGAAVEPIGFLDDDPALRATAPLGLPVLGGLAERVDVEAAIVAIGDNATRRELFERLRARGVKLATAIHPRAVVAAGVPIGPGSVVAAGAIVNTGSVVGVNAILNTGCTVDHHNQIGDHAHIAPGAHLAGQVHVGEGALVGIGATVLPKCRIGAWATVGAAALVRADIPEHATAVGVPARIIRR
jgi:sugar O-acyltransferase (sialic acid O-acetyltransferase NeuD family)